jgi:hypothetical protein
MIDGSGFVQIMTDLGPGGPKAYGSTKMITIIIVSVTVAFLISALIIFGIYYQRWLTKSRYRNISMGYSICCINKKDNIKLFKAVE